MNRIVPVLVVLALAAACGIKRAPRPPEAPPPAVGTSTTAN